jgi:hypothetical protein
MWAYFKDEPYSKYYDEEEEEWIIFSNFQNTYSNTPRKFLWNIVHNHVDETEEEVSYCANIYTSLTSSTCGGCGVKIPKEVRLVAELLNP